MPKHGSGLPKTLSCDLTEIYYQHGLVLISYKSLRFQPRKIAHNICDVTSSNHHNSAMFLVKKNNWNRQITAVFSKPQTKYGQL